MKYITVGDTVTWCGTFGADLPEKAEVLSMEVTEHPREKYGKKRNTVKTKWVEQNRVVFVIRPLEGPVRNKWCYSDQIILN